MPTFRADKEGRVAIFNGTDDVYYSPLNDTSRVLFHSDLTYPSILYSWEGYLSLVSMSANTQNERIYSLFYHGRPGVPLVFGTIVGLNYGYDIPLRGSVPVAMHPRGDARYINLCARAPADGGDVVVYENSLSIADQTFPAQYLYLRVYVYDVTIA
jgi:hypothetical protein